MTKVVINQCFGGFSLSKKALDMYNELSGKNLKSGYDYISRTDPHLVQVVETLGKEANGSCASLCVEYLEEGTLYRIQEYDGRESIETADNIGWEIA